MSSAGPFLTNGNYQKIVGFLRGHYAQRLGTSAIPERMDARIQKTVQHYMTEVAKAQGTNKPAQALNQEVLREASTSMDLWIRKQQQPVSAQAAFAATMPQLQPQQRNQPLISNAGSTVLTARPAATVPSSGGAGLGVGNAGSKAYVATAYEDLSSVFDRSAAPDALPQKTSFLNGASAAKFSPIDEDDEEEDPAVLMKRALKARELEGSMVSREAGKEPRMEIQDMAAVATAVDPTPQAQPPPLRTVPLQQDYIIPQEPVVKYREKEYNIFLTSSDRDWFRNRNENRYAFSVTFNPGNRNGFGYSPAVQERFRNIQRIEFVKALFPTESLATLVRRQSNYQVVSDFTTNTDRVLNVMGLPFVGVRIAELNNNGFSTNPREDNTFALVQYDATWNSAASVTNSTTTSVAPRTNVGYTAYIPKFLKCQRVYEPTPLAGLQKMTFRVERHDGAILSPDPDVFAIQRICLSDGFGNVFAGTTTNFSYGTTATNNSYIILRTDTFFPYSAVSEGDQITIQGYAATQVGGSPALATLDDFNRYINDTHYVVAVGNTDSNSVPATNIVDGANSVGYCNIIVLRSRFVDPTTGSTARSYFGGSSTEEDALATALNSLTQPVETTTAALLNTSRQTHVVLRVITRDMDSGSNIRPDNV